MRWWWCAGESKQRPGDSVEKPPTHTQDVALLVGSTGPALLRILLLRDGSGVLCKLYGVSRRPLSPPSAAVPISPPSAPVPLSPSFAPAPPDVFHGNLDLTDAEDVARANWATLTLSVFFSNCTKRLRVGLQTIGKGTVGATLLDNAVQLCTRVGLQTTGKGTVGASLLDNAVLLCSPFSLTDAGDIAKRLTGIVHIYVAWESRGTDAPAREANWAMLALSVFVSNCSKRLHVCLQTTGKVTVGATLLDNAFPLCSRFVPTDAGDIGKLLTGIVHFYIACESRGTDAPAREAKSPLLRLRSALLVCTKRLHFCLLTTGKCTVAALRACSHFDLIHPDNITIVKPLIVFPPVLCNGISVLVPRRHKRVHVCLHIGQNVGSPPAIDSTRTTTAGQVSYHEPARDKICAPSVGHWNTIKKVILIIVIFSLTTGVDSSSTGTSSMKNFCPKPNPAPCFISHQRKLCALMEETKDDFTTVHWIQSEHVAPAPSQQHRDTNINVICTIIAYVLLWACCAAPWVSIKNLAPENGRIHRFLFMFRIEPVSMWRYTLLISINFYASMIAYGVAYGLVPNPHERTMWNNFTWLELTTTIANAAYLCTIFLALIWLLCREKKIVPEANMVRSWLCSIIAAVLISTLHIVLGVWHPSNFQNIFLFEMIGSFCTMLMLLFRWFTMAPTPVNVLLNLCAIVSGIILLCIIKENKWYKWGVVFLGLLCRIIELITWTIWFRNYEGRNPVIVAEHANDD